METEREQAGNNRKKVEQIERRINRKKKEKEKERKEEKQSERVKISNRTWKNLLS